MKTLLKMLAICMMAGGLGVQSVYAEPLVIQEQGSFSAGGTIITAPGTFDAKKPLDSAGQTYHGDHASVFYQIPENPHKYPIVMLHGAGQSSRTWEISGRVLDYGCTVSSDSLNTPMPLPLKLYITPVGAAGGVVIKAGEVIARIHMYKIATLGSGNPRNFTWNIISNNSVVMPTGGCTVDSRNVTVNLPDFPGSAEIPLGVYCSSEQKLSFYLSGATTDSARQVFANAAPDATKASGVGVSLIRNGKILATGENVSLGTVNKSKVPLGLSATYGQTGNKVAAGAVQSVIGVTFIYE
ncbi:TPA: fimbrial protein [Escherichia coli]